MISKFKNINIIAIAKQLSDVRLLGLLAFGLVALLVTWSGIKAIQTNFQLQRQIAELDQKNRVIELANENMRLKNEYYKTDRYADLVARRQLGMAGPDETVLLVPKSVALSYAPEMEQDIDMVDEIEDVSNKPFYQENYEAWMDFFLNRNSMD